MTATIKEWRLAMLIDEKAFAYALRQSGLARTLNTVGDVAVIRKLFETYEAVKEQQTVSLTECPKCGGPADNGHDRCLPPSPYYCTKCMNAEEQQTVESLVRKLEEEKFRNVEDAEPYDSGYNSGIDEAISLIRQHFGVPICGDGKQSTEEL